MILRICDLKIKLWVESNRQLNQIHVEFLTEKNLLYSHCICVYMRYLTYKHDLYSSTSIVWSTHIVSNFWNLTNNSAIMERKQIDYALLSRFDTFEYKNVKCLLVTVSFVGMAVRRKKWFRKVDVLILW